MGSTLIHQPEGYVSERLFRILLAEDLEANATLAILRLEQQGHEVKWVKNGLEAVEECQKNQYDLILMDVMMPELDGLQATLNIRLIEQDSENHIPILALTASAMSDDSAKCIAAGMDGFVAKPIDFEHLFISMDEVVPEGVGVLNNVRDIDITPHQQVDFAPLNGVMDVNKAMKTWRVPEILAKALISFSLERTGDAVKMIRILAAHPDNLAEVCSISHALKGVASNLSLNVVADLATRIDGFLNEESRGRAEALLGELDGALQRVSISVAQIKLPDADLSRVTKSFNKEKVQSLLTELVMALNQLNPDIVEPVLASLAEYVEESELASIKDGVDIFDFDTSLDKTHELAHKLGLDLE